MHAPLSLKIMGSERTEWAEGYMTDEGLVTITRAELAALGISPEEFGEKARENAAIDLQALKPEYVRDKRKVIEFAEIHSRQPIVTSAVLAKSFLGLFKDTLGEKVLVIIPNRFTAYVFPALAGDYEDYSSMFLSAFYETAWPVSTEVFEFSARGIRCIARFDEH